MNKAISSKKLTNKSFPPNQKVVGMASKEEPVLIAFCLRDTAFIRRALDAGITDHHFFFAPYGNLFRSVIAYYERYDSLLTRDAYQRLIDTHVTNDDRGNKEMIQFTRIKAIRANADDFNSIVKTVKDRYIQWMFYDRMVAGDNGIVQKIVGATHGQRKLIQTLQDRLTEVEVAMEEGEATKARTLSEVTEAVLKKLERRRDDPAGTRGQMCGIKAIDNTLIGMRKGEYIVIVGYPNGGKTTMMMNMAVGMVWEGARVLYVTVESDDEDLGERIISMRSSVSSKAMRVGGMGEDGLNKEAFEDILTAGKEIEQYGDNMVLVTIPRQTSVKRVLSLIESKRKEREFDAVFVDYLDVIGSIKSYGDRRDLEIGEVSVQLQSYATTRGLIMVTAQSFNNEMIKAIKKQQERDRAKGEDNVGHVIGLHGVGGTQKIVRDADVVFGLIMSANCQRLYVYWMKSRNSEKADRFCFRAVLDCCQLFELDKDAMVSASQVTTILKGQMKTAQKKLTQQAGGSGGDPPKPDDTSKTEEKPEDKSEESDEKQDGQEDSPACEENPEPAVDGEQDDPDPEPEEQFGGGTLWL